MRYEDVVVLFAILLLVSMIVLLEAGRRMGARRARLDPDGAKASVGAMDGAVFALLGLLIAFTFSGAASRFDTRRDLIVQEANAIGTAYLRVALLPTESQPALRDSYRQYVDSRLAAYRKLPDLEAVRKELARNEQLQKSIWAASLEGCRTLSNPAVTTLVVTALNDMIDITTTRTMAGFIHPPGIIFAMLFGVALASALLGGYAMGTSSPRRTLLHMLAFATVTALTIYVVLEIEYPRLGLIQVTDFDRALVDVRAGMNE